MTPFPLNALLECEKDPFRIPQVLLDADRKGWSGSLDRISSERFELIDSFLELFGHGRRSRDRLTSHLIKVYLIYRLHLRIPGSVEFYQDFTLL